MQDHEHTVNRTGDEYGFSVCVSPYECNPCAHGGVMLTEYCECGMERSVNVNFLHIEEGPWQEPS